MDSYVFALAIAQVIWIDVLLSGDNAVVIALACRSLPPRQRRVGLTLGVSLAIAARLVLAFAASSFLTAPGVQAIGALFILYVAVKVIVGEDDAEPEDRGARGLWTAAVTIVVADVTMSIDNVIAIVGASRGNGVVFAIGLIVSMPLTIGGAALMTRLMTRFPIIVWSGGALLGWIAGDLLATDPLVIGVLSSDTPISPITGSVVGGATAVLVIATGVGVRRWRTAQQA